MLKLPNKPSLNNECFLVCRAGTDWYWPQSLPCGRTSIKICRHILYNHICVLISFNGHPVFPGSHNCFMITLSPYICSRQCLTCNTLLRSSHIKCSVAFFYKKLVFISGIVNLHIIDNSKVISDSHYLIPILSIKCSSWIHN